MTVVLEQPFRDWTHPYPLAERVARAGFLLQRGHMGKLRLPQHDTGGRKGANIRPCHSGHGVMPVIFENAAG
jgi:hypothetical protein